MARQRAAEELRQQQLPACQKHWDNLSRSERAMAARLGFTRKTWIADQWHGVPHTWDDLAPVGPTRTGPTKLDEARALGFTRDSWHGGRSNVVQSDINGGTVICPWPQCKGRIFKAATRCTNPHQDHCNAKHGGQRAPRSSACPPTSGSSSAAPVYPLQSSLACLPPSGSSAAASLPPLCAAFIPATSGQGASAPAAAASSSTSAATSSAAPSTVPHLAPHAHIASTNATLSTVTTSAAASKRPVDAGGSVPPVKQPRL